MRLPIIAALVASLASLGAEPAEAISFSSPIYVVKGSPVQEPDGGWLDVRWASDGGTCLTPTGWSKVDNSFRDLQVKVDQHDREPSNAGWFFAGIGTGAGVTAISAIVLFFALKKN